MKTTNGVTNGYETAPVDHGSVSSSVLYSLDVRRNKRFEHEENIDSAQRMVKAWTSLVETFCHTTYYKTFPFLKAVESYLREGGDAREVIEYDQRKTKEREEKIQEFYRKMICLTRITRRDPSVLSSRQARGSIATTKKLQKITEAVLSMPLDRSLWVDFASYLTEDEQLKSAHYATVNSARARFIGLRNQMVQGNLRLVFPIVRKYLRKGVDYADLLQEGNIGLLKGVEKFDYTKNYHLSTYATYWIEQQIDRAVKEKSREIRIPTHRTEEMIRVQIISTRLKEQLKREENLAELAEATGFSEAKIEQLKELYSRCTYSLQTPRSSEYSNNGTLEDTIEDVQVKSPLERIMEQRRAEDIEQSLSAYLSPREQELITLRFGLGDDQDHTLDEIGKKWDLTRERIRQIEVKTLGKLNRSKRLRSFAR